MPHGGLHTGLFDTLATRKKRIEDADAELAGKDEAVLKDELRKLNILRGLGKISEEEHKLRKEALMRALEAKKE